MRRKIIFRADAGYRIGYGHFVRSLALADMLKDDFECEFYTSGPTPYQINEAEGICPLNALPTDDSKFGSFLSVLKGDETVVLDNYFYDIEYQKKIVDKGCRLVCIDDRFDIEYYADAVINHVVGISGKDLHNHKNGLFFSGPAYSLLRKEFRKPPAGDWNRCSCSIMIALGGVDYDNNALGLYRKLSGKTTYDLCVVVGDGYKYPDALADEGATVYRNLTAGDLCGLIEKQLLVVCTPSTMAYEVASRGIPMIVGSYADNHHDVEKRIEESGIGLGCGRLSDVTSDRLIELIGRATSDRCMVNRQRECFDGRQKNRFLALFSGL